METLKRSYVTNVDITSEGDLSKLKEFIVSNFQNNQDIGYYCVDDRYVADGVFTATYEEDENPDGLTKYLTPSTIETIEEKAHNLLAYLREGLCQYYYIHEESSNTSLTINLYNKEKPIGYTANQEDTKDFILI